MKLSADDEQFIRNNKNLIDDGNWDKFFNDYFDYSRHYNRRSLGTSKLYQFLMFEVGIDLLHKMSYIPIKAFRSCEYDLGDLVIPSNIKELKESAFEWCDTIISIDLSKTKITEIHPSCFRCCDNLKKVVLPNTCKIIHPYAFCECVCLTSINLDEIKEIWGDGFQWCTNLSSIKLNKSVKFFEDVDNIFRYCSLTDITTPKEYAEEFKEEFIDADIKFV